MLIIPPNRAGPAIPKLRPAAAGELLLKPGGAVMEIKRSGSRPLRKRTRRSISREQCASTHCSRRPNRRVFAAPASPSSRERDIRPWHTHPLGHNPDRDLRRRLGPAAGGPVEDIRPGERRVVRAGREALARRHARDGDDAHRHSGSAERQPRRLDGAGHRRAISGKGLMAVRLQRRTNNAEAQTRQERSGRSRPSDSVAWGSAMVTARRWTGNRRSR